MEAKIKVDTSRYPFVSVAFLIVIGYLFFQGNNPFSEDSIAYANNVKYGEDLFWSHHLLYSAFNYGLYMPLKQLIPSLDAFRFMQFINGVFGLLSLFTLHRIICRLYGSEKADRWTFLVASCFGVIRFSVEVETYIIPIFFSLLSSFFYLKFIRSGRYRYILFCSLAASTACLFHQIHLFWGIGLFVGFLSTRKIKPILLYLLPTLSVLIVYSIVMVLYTNKDFSFNNLWQYLADYYYSDKAKTGIGMMTVVLIGISLIRTFFQVHGMMLEVLRLIPLFWLVFPVVILLLGVGIYRLKGLRFKRLRCAGSEFETTHLLIFIMQFGFAFVSAGNAEFMAMLPFLIPMFIYIILDFEVKAITFFSTAMLIWNFCFSVFPNHYLDYANDRQVLRVIRENPDKVFILEQRNILVEKLYYHTGSYEDDRLIHNREEDILRLLPENKTFYTNVLSKKTPFNRARLTIEATRNILHFEKHIEKIPSQLGDYYIDEVTVVVPER